MSLRSIRLTRQLSQEQLAQIAGLNVRTIQRLENGAKASRESLKCLAAALEVEIIDIVQQEPGDLDKDVQRQPNTVFLCLAIASIFILFGAKSESTYQELGAFFYVSGALCFIWAAIRMRKDSQVD